MQCFEFSDGVSERPLHALGRAADAYLPWIEKPGVDQGWHEDARHAASAVVGHRLRKLAVVPVGVLLQGLAEHAQVVLAALDLVVVPLLDESWGAEPAQEDEDHSCHEHVWPAEPPTRRRCPIETERPRRLGQMHASAFGD